jgi:hypothetical protein
MLILSSIGFCDSIEDGWQNIKPLRTNRSSVDKLLGSAKKSSPGYFNYKTDDASIQVNYTTAPCQPDSLERGKYNLPESTVLDYRVLLNKKVKLSVLKFNRVNYKREKDAELIGLTHYENIEEGIHITTGDFEGIEYVLDIRFRASKVDSEKFRCKDEKTVN